MKKDGEMAGRAPNAMWLLGAGFMAILAAGVGFAIRGGILDNWGREYGFSNTEQGMISGAGFTSFCFGIILGGFVADRIGYMWLVVVAFAAHVLSAVITFGFSESFDKDTIYQFLYWGTFLFGFANGTLEAVANPLVATLFPDRRTHYLNILHASWPAGMILGGVAGWVLDDMYEMSWKWQLALFLVPTAIYGLMFIGQAMPKSEASKSGLSLGEMMKDVGLVGGLVVCFFLAMFFGPLFSSAVKPFHETIESMTGIEVFREVAEAPAQQANSTIGAADADVVGAGLESTSEPPQDEDPATDAADTQTEPDADTDADAEAGTEETAATAPSAAEPKLEEVLFYGVGIGQWLGYGLGGILLIAIGVMTRFSVGSLLLFVLFVAHAMVGAVELGTDGWIQNITGNILTSEQGKILFVYTSAIMFALRFCAHFIETRIGLSPVGLLLLCSVMAVIGLNLTSMVNSFAFALLALSIYGFGKTFFWPTMLAVASDRFPKTGAVAISIMGGIGMMSAGLIGAPGLGYLKDKYSGEALLAADTMLYDEFKSTKPSGFLFFEPVIGIDTEKFGKITEEIKKIKEANAEARADNPDAPQQEIDPKSQMVVDASIQGDRDTLKADSLIPAAMAVIYLLLAIYFKSIGGYRALSLSEQNRLPTDSAGGVTAES